MPSQQPQSQAKELRQIYPTMQLFGIAIQSHGTQKALAEELNMCSVSLRNHKKWLLKGGMAVRERLENPAPRRKHRDLRNGELDARIRQMVGTGYAKVEVYKLREDYVPGQVMDQGDFVREEVGATALSCWGRVVE